MENDRIRVLVNEAEADIIGWKNTLHQYPELSLKEKDTSGKIVELVRKMGFDICKTFIDRMLGIYGENQ